jgi:hypothetical protein
MALKNADIRLGWKRGFARLMSLITVKIGTGMRRLKFWRRSAAVGMWVSHPESDKIDARFSGSRRMVNPDGCCGRF